MPHSSSSKLHTLATLPNLGPKSAAWLIEAGIRTPMQLKKVGVVAAYKRVKLMQGPRASLNLLWALAAALMNIDWRDLPPDIKTQLKTELHKEG